MRKLIRSYITIQNVTVEMELLSMFKFVICLLSACQPDTDQSKGLQKIPINSQNTNLSSGLHSFTANDSENELETHQVPSVVLQNTKTKREAIVQQQVEEFGLLERAVQPKNVNGRPCNFNVDCISGCCLAPTREARQCAPMASRGDRCESSQIKGGYYADFCPCLAGDDSCRHTGPTATRHMICQN